MVEFDDSKDQEKVCQTYPGPPSQKMKCNYCKYGNQTPFWTSCLARNGRFARFIEPDCQVFEQASTEVLSLVQYISSVNQYLLFEINRLQGNQGATVIMI